MKKNSLYISIPLFILLSLISLSSCKKKAMESQQAVTIPVVTTNSVSLLTHNSLVSGGNVTSEGEASIVSKGVCWSTQPNVFLTSTNFTSEGTGSGLFSSSVSGLTPNTTYYLRAYAVNSVGTAYGNEITFTTKSKPLEIGDLYLNGYVAYLLQSGDVGYDAEVQHGFVVSNGDVAKWLVWGCKGTGISGADDVALGTGLQNTVDINSQCSSGAAYICSTNNGWYLPSKDELNKLYINKDLLHGLSDLYYWSSSEVDNDNAWAINFVTGNAESISKDQTQVGSLGVFTRAFKNF